MKGQYRADPGGDPKLAFDNDPDTFWFVPPNTHNALLEVSFPASVSLDRAVIMCRGHNILLYGSVTHATQTLLDLLNLGQLSPPHRRT